MTELFPTPPVKTKAERKGPIMERLEQHVRDHRYEAFTLVELYDLFESDKPEAIRNAIRKLFKEKLIKSTGELRHRKNERSQVLNDSDVVCLTLAIGK
jgi:hypothetical protein